MTKQIMNKMPIGSAVYCTVEACKGWYTITAIRPRDGYIKIGGFSTWSPPHNFSLSAGETIQRSAGEIDERA